MWPSPYEPNEVPQAAASIWIKREWDCRHRELVTVAVRDGEGGLWRVKMRARVTLTLEREGEL